MKSSYRLLLIALSLAGCSTQQAYEAGRTYRDNQCLNLPQAMMQDCRKQNGMGYDEYRREAGQVK